VNITDQFLFQAQSEPTALAVCAPGTRYNAVSYGRLAVFVGNIAAHGRQAGIRPGDTVAIAVGDPIFHLALILGMAKLGAVTVSMLGTTLPGEVAATAVLTERAVGLVNAGRLIFVDPTWVEGDGQIPIASAATDDDLAITRIALTSGTTGDQKAVALRNIDIVRRLQAYNVAFGNRASVCSRVFIDVGLSTSYGFTWTLHVLSRGGAVFFRGADPAETMQAFGLYKVQCMVASPAGIAEFLDYYEQSPGFVSPFGVLFASGSLLSRTLSERVRARMGNHLITTYGSTEVSPVAAAAAYRVADTPGAVGYVMPWLSVEAVDENDQPVRVGSEGIIRIRGDTCVAGYIGNPPGSEEIFRDGWFYPGDIGAVTKERLLIISGREKAVLNLGGDKVNPETIEMALLSCPGVMHAAAFGKANSLGIDEVWAVVVTLSDLNAEAIRAHCARRLPSAFVPARIVTVPRIPRNEMGRIERDQLSKLAGAD
jgi:acyl-CoA synthetase (AMP-forming)/AMP-acid ligase II